MAQVLFYLSILADIGTLVIPLTTSTRGRAVWGWLANALAGGVYLMLLERYFPSWREPHWHTGALWTLAAWIFFISGFIIAIRKPRKRDKTVA